MAVNYCKMFSSMVFVTLSLINLSACIDFEICHHCDAHDDHDSNIQEICESFMAETIVDRCCWNSTKLLGVDLSNCSLDSTENLFQNYTSLVAIDLRENENLTDFPASNFAGLSKLDYLYLPENATCPGGNLFWNYTDSSTCFYQLEACKVYNISCLENGDCVYTMPGQGKCQCKSGYSGYKCLISDKFPTVLYSVTLSVSTVVLSAALWWTQRRKVVSN